MDITDTGREMDGSGLDTMGRLRTLVKADPRSAREIAESAGINRGHLSQVMTAHRRSPSLATVGAILGALGRDWADLDPDRVVSGRCP